jgi:hypothetical protein
MASFDRRFDEIGDYCKRVVVQDTKIAPAIEYFYDTTPFDVSVSDSDIIVNIVTAYATTCLPIMYRVHRAHTSATSTSPINVNQSSQDKRDFDSLPFFGYLPSDIIKTTFKKTTQYARMPMSTIMKKRYKSPNPAMNVHR